MLAGRRTRLPSDRLSNWGLYLPSALSIRWIANAGNLLLDGAHCAAYVLAEEIALVREPGLHRMLSTDGVWNGIL